MRSRKRAGTIRRRPPSRRVYRRTVATMPPAPPHSSTGRPGIGYVHHRGAGDWDVLDIERGITRATRMAISMSSLAIGRSACRCQPIGCRTCQSLAGYFAAPEMDLIDLFVGAEGTLGVMTEVTLRVRPSRRRGVWRSCRSRIARWRFRSCECCVRRRARHGVRGRPRISGSRRVGD